MAKLYTSQNLISKHQPLRAAVSEISKLTTDVRNSANKASAEAEKLYDRSGLSKTAKRDAIERHVRATVDTSPVKAKIAPLLREMEGHRLQLEEARPNMLNPIRRLNALTLMERKMIESRYAAMQMLDGVGPAELEVAAEAAKIARDFGMLAAVVSRNNQLPSKDRRFTNAELLADVELPGQADIDAVYQELDVLPKYAISCSRAVDNLGRLAAEDRIELGLSERQVHINEDGSLADFQTTEPMRYKLDGSEVTGVNDPKLIDSKKPDPKDFDNYVDFAEAGGKATDLTHDDDIRFFGVATDESTTGEQP